MNTQTNDKKKEYKKALDILNDLSTKNYTKIVKDDDDYYYVITTTNKKRKILKSSVMGVY